MTSLLFFVSFAFTLHLVDAGYKEDYAKAVSELDWDGVKKDLIAFYTDSQDWWPADYGNYGPFMIRQAWHCSGSYRSFDGRGGCDGGRQRFDPERSWEDNTNLDKAKRLLWPIKEKYGLGLSWGDLIILAGTTAIESMGGPILGFCAGRIDDFDGSASELLGPTHVQEETYPCKVNGQCKKPFGTTTVGLIYVNPEGPMGQPIPKESAGEVRDTFGRMNMNDMETVALIGGGHAFGKTHGACPKGAGPSPKQDPSNPWPGECGTGKGKDTYTSGFEGAWSTNPTKWGNYYFQELVKNNWEVYMGPGGHHQWRTVGGTKGVMMLTSDISLLNDPNGSYQNWVKLFATNLTALDDAFSHAWYKLTTRDMGPVTRCVGPWVPPPQPFQYPLPQPPSKLPDFHEVRKAIKHVMYTNQSSILWPDTTREGPYYGAVFVHLAWQCATTFRHTDYQGGCNGARIRFPPQSTWPMNVALDKALQLLAPIQKQFENLSWADLIVLAGTVAIEDATNSDIEFCGGRTDATDGQGSMSLRPNGNYSLTFDQIRRDVQQLIGLTEREIVALSARLRSPGQMYRSGWFAGSFTSEVNVLSNSYFRNLVSLDWYPKTVPGSGNVAYFSEGTPYTLTPFDLGLKWDATYLAISQVYAEDNGVFLEEFKSAWVKLMNLDRFNGPAGNVCKKH